MAATIFEKLHSDGFISEASFEKIKAQESKQLLSVHWELKTILYLGVLLLTTGLGIIIYKNIDSIGHQAILAFIALLSAGSFYYCYKTKLPYAVEKVEAPNPFYDYVLLLGGLSFITFIGYLQFQFQVFGTRYGLATFIPMLVIFFSAYYFDHLGLLSIAITNLAAWAGIAVTPTRILAQNDFNSQTIIFTGLLLGAVLMGMGVATQKINIKKHFEFTYSNFGTHILFISCLAALFNFEATYLLWFLLLVGICFFFYRKAIKEKSFYFMLLLTLYGYVGLSYVIVRLLFYTGNAEMAGVYLAFLYFIASAIGMIVFLISMNKKLKK